MLSELFRFAANTTPSQVADNGVLITALSVIAVAIVTSIGAPIVADRLRERRDNDPMRGWRTAYSDMSERVKSLESEVKSLREEVNALENTVTAQSDTIARQNVTIEQQSHAIRARDNRIVQLEEAWPASVSRPQPDPAVIRWLAQGSF